MDDGTRKVRFIFVRNLTNGDKAEIEGYVSEIIMNRKFHNHLELNRNDVSRRQYWSWGISPTLGIVLYALCRMQKPDIVMETGVFGGVSSSYILCALEENKQGLLYSIDLDPGFTPPNSSPGLLKEKQSGWVIPEYLRHRWHLVQGRTSEEFGPLLEKVGQIDLFLHDSEHTYRNMLWEFQTAWANLKPGGLLLSHNIDVNDAFSDFCRRVGVKGYLLTNMGGAVKPL